MAFGFDSNDGIPLPFVSYGGTSYLIFSVALGIVIKIIANERRQLNGQYKNSTYILIMIYYCPFLLTLLSSGVQYWIAVNEGKDGTVPALKQLFFIFVGYAGMFLASRLSQKFIWKVAPFSMGFH